MEKTDLEFMKSPVEWSLWPMLPVKRCTKERNEPECGFMMAEGKPKVYLMNQLQFLMEHKLRSEVPVQEYESFDALVADGWIVD